MLAVADGERYAAASPSAACEVLHSSTEGNVRYCVKERLEF